MSSADTLDRSTSALGLLARVVGGFAFLIVATPFACIGLHHLEHPAPLGRSADAIRRRVDAALPMGTTVDSARRFLEANGSVVSVYDVADARRFHGADSRWSGGPVLVAVQRAVTRDIYVWDVTVTLFFTPGGGLVRGEAQASPANPL